MQTYRVLPTLDLAIDIEATCEDEAIKKTDELVGSIIAEACQKMLLLGFQDVNQPDILDGLFDEEI